MLSKFRIIPKRNVVSLIRRNNSIQAQETNDDQTNETSVSKTETVTEPIIQDIEKIVNLNFTEVSNKIKKLNNCEIPKHIIPTINDQPCIRSPGELVDLRTIVRNWWAFPGVGFNTILKIPVQKLELFEGDVIPKFEPIILPNHIFGLPLRKDVLHKIYWYHRHAMAGYLNRYQLDKFEWPGRVDRKRPLGGGHRMGMGKACTLWPGSFSHPKRPTDQALDENRKTVWLALKTALSAKFVNNLITVVDTFKLRSHKTKYLIEHVRRLLGVNCKYAMFIHEGNGDQNEEFRWASAHIARIERQNVTNLNAYNIIKTHHLVFTEKALHQLIFEIDNYPKKMKWGARFATMDGKPAPRPKAVEGWNTNWKLMKERFRKAEYTKEDAENQRKWRWLYTTRGPMKTLARDPLKKFRIKTLSVKKPETPWSKHEIGNLYEDDEPLDEEEQKSTMDQILDRNDDFSFSNKISKDDLLNI
eukprot:GHVL01008956.1.p1 GENE.GHVL01008956.1~~GHVL01008956.1.p1  ORF type:complete len:472 (-),score=90.64 GHVL01008956.1:845-2260(-)